MIMAAHSTITRHPALPQTNVKRSVETPITGDIQFILFILSK
jgi:hypothetical protein